MSEAATVASLALALLESIAHATATGAGSGLTGGIVAEAAAVAAVALTSLEGVADGTAGSAGSIAGGITALGVVGETARIASGALTYRHTKRLNLENSASLLKVRLINKYLSETDSKHRTL